MPKNKTMRLYYHFLYLLKGLAHPQCFLLAGVLLSANHYLSSQEISLPTGRNTDAPIQCNIPGVNRSILFFHATIKLKTQVCAVEVDSLMQPVRTSSMVILNAPDPALPIRFLGTFCPKGKNKCMLYFKLHTTQLWALTLDLDSFSIHETQCADLPPDAIKIGGLQVDDQFEVLMFEKGRKGKDGMVTVLTTSDGLSFERHEMAAKPELSLFDKHFKPIIPVVGVEMFAEIAAAHRDKIFAGKERIYILSDEQGEGTHPAFTEVLTIDLRTYALSMARYSCLDTPLTGRNEVAGYIMDDKLFQMGLKKDFFALQVTDLITNQPLFSKVLTGDALLSNLLNSKVIVPIRGLPGIEKEYEKVTGFTQKLLPFKTFLQVRALDRFYIVGMGGYEEGSTPGNPGAATNNAGTAYERSTFFYTILYAKDCTHAPDYIANSIQSQIKTLTEIDPPIYGTSELVTALSGLRAGGIYRHAGKDYYGQYSRKKDGYEFKVLRPVF